MPGGLCLVFGILGMCFGKRCLFFRKNAIMSKKVTKFAKSLRKSDNKLLFIFKNIQL